MIYIILILVLVSGLIAYLGDWLGRKMGKRRLRLFGMRPRYTAIVVTTITGMLIATLTFGTLIAVNKNLRKVVLRGQQLVHDNEELAATNQEFEARNQQLHELNGKLFDRSAGLTAEVKAKSAQVTQARKQAAAAIKARDVAQLHVRGLERLISERQRELALLRRTGRQTELRLAMIQESLKSSRMILIKVKSDLELKNRDLLTTKHDLDTKTKDLASKMEALDAAKKSVDSAASQIKYNEDVIREQQDEIAKEAQRAENLYTGDMVLPQGTEIGRKVINSDQSADRVHQELVDLLDSGSDKAKKLEAGSPGSKRAIQLVFTDITSGKIVSADEETCIDAAVKAIVNDGRTGPTDAVLATVTVVRNTLKGETALADLRLGYNSLAFGRGDRISQCIVDGRQSEGRVLLAVLDFLKGGVRASAETHGVLRVANPDPDKAAEQISDEQLDRLIGLVQTIRETGRQIELKAVAQKDIYAAGPLSLDNIRFTISTKVASVK